ncbi:MULTISPECIES: PP2C family protein-serine/threonine phosphatase [Streptomyces]|uniref:PP2C family protein-serine/threonine phosphatase n=2 Tax=Streptomyces TaxID=1883 RepID=A0ABU4KI46_9ACTN|nr:PP2C family protein-serine/threonine phosphatase [Streptomyces roseolus]MDX2297480.1 PP2C family protein-serine/threonine phosphatase [Streptomyces roseolus]
MLVVVVALMVIDVLLAVRVRTGPSLDSGRAERTTRDIGRLFSVIHESEEARHVLAAESGTAPVPDVHADRALVLADAITRETATLGLDSEGTALNSALSTWVVNPAAGIQPLLTTTDRLAAALDARKARARHEAETGQNTLFALHCVFVAALLLLLGGLVWTLWRRIVRPLADLEARLGSLAADAAPLPPPDTRGWLGGVWSEAERTLLLLKQSRHRATQADLALRTDAVTSLGLQRILAAQHSPGPGVDAHGELMAAEGLIAGDFFDTLALSDGTTALIQGDVAGHGVEAGLLAVQTKSAVLSALRLSLDPRVAAAAAWSMLSTEDERFTTLVITVLDPGRGRLRWLNAGHEFARVRRADGSVEELPPTGPVIGSFVTVPEDTWEVVTTTLSPGDLVLLATDGLTEARDAHGAMLGEQTVTDLLADTGPDPRETVRRLHLTAQHHGTDWERDDITVLAATLTDPGAANAN